MAEMWPKFEEKMKKDPNCTSCMLKSLAHYRSFTTISSCKLVPYLKLFQDGMNETAMAAFKYTYGPLADLSTCKKAGDFFRCSKVSSSPAQMLWPQGVYRAYIVELRTPAML